MGDPRSGESVSDSNYEENSRYEAPPLDYPDPQRRIPERLGPGFWRKKMHRCEKCGGQCEIARPRKAFDTTYVEWDKHGNPAKTTVLTDGGGPDACPDCTVRAETGYQVTLLERAELRKQVAFAWEQLQAALNSDALGQTPVIRAARTRHDELLDNYKRLGG